MNIVLNTNTEYISPSRTIETLLISDFKDKKVYFVYNYEGYSLRLFTCLLNMVNFFKNENTKSDYHFNSEAELDAFLEKVNLQEQDLKNAYG